MSTVVHAAELVGLVTALCFVHGHVRSKQRDGWWWWWWWGICALVCLSAVKLGYVSQGRAGDSMVSVSTCLDVREKKFHLGAIMAASVKAEARSPRR